MTDRASRLPITRYYDFNEAKFPKKEITLAGWKERISLEGLEKVKKAVTEEIEKRLKQMGS